MYFKHTPNSAPFTRLINENVACVLVVDWERGVCSPSQVFCVIAWENGDRISVGTAPNRLCALVQ